MVKKRNGRNINFFTSVVVPTIKCITAFNLKFLDSSSPVMKIFKQQGALTVQTLTAADSHLPVHRVAVVPSYHRELQSFSLLDDNMMNIKPLFTALN